MKNNKTKLLTYTLSAFALLLAPVNAAKDTLILRPNKTYDGLFTAYKNNALYFKPADGKEFNKRAIMIKSLTLNPPAEVHLTPRGKPKMENILFKSYASSKFIFEANGKELSYTTSKITKIEIAGSWSGPQREYGDPDGEEETKEIVLEDAIKPGKVTIVHFHLVSDEPNPAIRMENFVDALPESSKGKIEVIKINVKGWQDPKAEKYMLKTLPQFWFYNKKATLSSKMTERFTAEDIDKAIKATSK